MTTWTTLTKLLPGPVRTALVRQFHHPRGLAGRLAGRVMARRRSNRERSEWAVSLLDVRPTERVLEIGFGPGVAVAALAARARDGVVHGVDHSAVMVRQATRRNAAAVRAGRVRLVRAGVHELPAFTAGPGDTVLMPRNLPHAYYNRGEGHTRGLFWVGPAGRLAALFDHLHDLTDPEEVVRVSAEHDVHFLPPGSVEGA